ncbi:phytoene/squalene synthase family protein [Limibacillus sp. MBR-115]|jgi:phytoene synthase|uniref:phytoene/squalene synthase family protein n=1 Tax=Limibacillus sp. MBR-115 TaxID=3156465 RepID=UPI00339B2301
MTLTDDLSYCSDQLRRLDHDRYLITLLAPERTRASLLALYAFNLEIARTAESVSEPMLGQIRLQWWREAIEGIYSGTPRRHAVIQPLNEAIRSLELPRAHFDALIDARESDLESEPFADREEFLRYTEITGGLIEELAVRTVAPDEAEAWSAARQVGQAWAIIGIMRAVPFMAAQGRAMLPMTDLRAAGMTRDDLTLSGKDSKNGSRGLAGIVEAYVQVAQENLTRARREAKHLPRQVIQQLSLARIADLHIKRFARYGYDPFNGKLQINPPSRAWRLLVAKLLNRF